MSNKTDQNECKIVCMDCGFPCNYGSKEMNEHKKEQHWRGFVLV